MEHQVQEHGICSQERLCSRKCNHGVFEPKTVPVISLADHICVEPSACAGGVEDAAGAMQQKEQEMTEQEHGQEGSVAKDAGAVAERENEDLMAPGGLTKRM